MGTMDLFKTDRMPQVGAAMTPFPFFVEPTDTADTIERMMDQYGIRHMPVQENGEVIGLVSERDLHRLVNRALPQVDKAKVCAADIMVVSPYVVDIHAPLADVVSEMARRRIGSALVAKKGKLAGILSVTDVCTVLALMLRKEFGTASPEGGDGGEVA